MAQNPGEAYSLKYDRAAYEELAALDSFWQDEIERAIETKLPEQPQSFGKPLRHSLKGCRALRIGDYRVVFQIQLKVVRIVAIIHRSTDYKGIAQRL